MKTPFELMEEEKERSYTGKMLPGDNINEVRDAATEMCLFIFPAYTGSSLRVSSSFLTLFSSPLFTKIHTLFSCPPLFTKIHILFSSPSLFTKIRAGPLKSSFALASYRRLFLPRNMKNTQNMLHRRRKEWKRAEKKG